VTQNSYQAVAWLHSTNAVVGEVMATTNSVQTYFSLADQNEALAKENAQLKQLLSRRDMQFQSMLMDTMTNQMLDTMAAGKANQYRYTISKVINNSVALVNNYLTLDKGTDDGLRPGMGVVSPTGIVGQVSLCSGHYSTVTSILHSRSSISVAIKGSNAIGTLHWKGNDPKTVNLEYIARHIKPKMGDTVLTSATSDIFPAGLTVGRIKKVKINDNDTFYSIEVDLATDFSTLGFVYLIDNKYLAEKDSLEQNTRKTLDVLPGKAR
jgi:rod shape-determining protein MreC